MKENVLVREAYNDDAELIMISKDDIEKVVYFGDANNIFKAEREFTEQELASINTRFEIIKENEDNELNELMDYEIVAEIVKDLNIKNEINDISEVEVLGDKDPAIITVDGNLTQCLLSDCSFDYSYEYWDGSNWRRMYLEEIDEDTVSFDKVEWISLDEFDGNNLCFKSSFNHAKVAKLGDKWLIKKYSDFQGSHEYVTVIESKEELESWFDENEVDMPEGL
jgi:hypothetical protein